MPRPETRPLIWQADFGNAIIRSKCRHHSRKRKLNRGVSFRILRRYHNVFGKWNNHQMVGLDFMA